MWWAFGIIWAILWIVSRLLKGYAIHMGADPQSFSPWWLPLLVTGIIALLLALIGQGVASLL